MKGQPTYVQIGVTETGTAIYRKTSTLAEEMVADIVEAVERKASKKPPVVPVVKHDAGYLPTVAKFICANGLVIIVTKPDKSLVHAVLPANASFEFIAQAVATLQKVKADRIPTDWAKIAKLGGTE